MNKKVTNLIINNLHIIVAAVYAAFLVCGFFTSDATSHPALEACVNATDNWYYRYYTNGSGWLKLNVPTFVDNTAPEKGTIYHLTSTLPDNVPNNHAIAFQSQNCWVSVSINGTLRYTNIPSQHVVKADYLGVTTHIVPVPVADAGQSIEITYIPCTDNDSTLIDTVYSGDSTQLFLAIILRCLIPVILAIAIIYIGIHTFTCALSSKNTRSGQALIYNGLFCAVFGVLTISQLDFMQMLIQHPAFFYEIKLITLSLLSFLALHYIIPATDVLPVTRHRVIQCIPLICFAIILLTHITGLIPIIRFIPLIFVETIYAIAAAVYYVIRYIIRQCRHKSLHKVSLICFLVFMLCFVGETYIYHAYTRNLLPYLSSVVLLLHQLFMQHRHNCELQRFAEIGQNVEHLQDAAYYDSLTQLMNRTALNRDMDKLDKHLYPNSSIAIIQLDLNFLKRTNDILGHIAGDRLLTNAAHAIHVGFADYGNCYRFGGDEFVVILIDNPKEKYNLGIAAMENECERINSMLPPMEHVSIAYGIAYYVPDTDTSLWRVQERADIAMYERKRMMKQQMSSMKYTDDRL